MKNKKKYLLLPFALTLLIIVIAASAMAQNQPLPAAVSSYVPKGYDVLNRTTGDLNLDQYPDLILVLNKPNEAETSDVVSHPEKRPLLIFIGGPDHSYTFAGRSDNAVYCIDCGGALGDPFEAVSIKHGYFSVEHFGGSAWRWTRIITFKYSTTEKNWFLYKDGNESFHTSAPNKITRKTYTVKNFGKVPFHHFDIYKE
jgi:hypothetical protein